MKGDEKSAKMSTFQGTSRRSPENHKEIKKRSDNQAGKCKEIAFFGISDLILELKSIKKKGECCDGHF